MKEENKNTKLAGTRARVPATVIIFLFLNLFAQLFSQMFIKVFHESNNAINQWRVYNRDIAIDDIGDSPARTKSANSEAEDLFTHRYF